MLPDVSVIMSAYNAVATIQAAVDSVQKQTWQNWELLAINDGSTDETLAVLESLSRQDRRIQVISQPNQGVSASRNLGIQIAQGQYIALLDADDIWLPNKLKSHIQHMEANPDLVVSFARVAFIDAEGKLTGQISTSSLKNLQLANLLYENPTTTTSNIFVKRHIFEQVGNFATDMSFAEDLEWLCRAVWLTKGKIEGIDQVLVQYRTSQGGLSSDLYRMEKGWETLINKVRAYAPNEVKRHYAIARAIHLRYLARRAYRLKLAPEIGVDFMNRAFQSNLGICLKQPHRTFLTALVTYGRNIFS